MQLAVSRYLAAQNQWLTVQQVRIKKWEPQHGKKLSKCLISLN